MALIHSTNYASIVPILREGIRPTTETRVFPSNYGVSKPNRIYFTFFHTHHPPISTDYLKVLNSPGQGIWGGIHVFLREDWVREHTTQLEERSLYFNTEFKRFIKSYGIKRCKDRLVGSLSEDSAYNQVISYLSVPADGLDAVLMESQDNCISPAIGKWSKDQDLRVRDILPEHMKLYLAKRKGYSRDYTRIERIK